MLLDLVLFHPSILLSHLQLLVRHLVTLLSGPMHINDLEGDGGGKKGQGQKIVPLILSVLVKILGCLHVNRHSNMVGKIFPQAILRYSDENCYNGSVILYQRKRTIPSLFFRRRRFVPKLSENTAAKGIVNTASSTAGRADSEGSLGSNPNDELHPSLVSDLVLQLKALWTGFNATEGALSIDAVTSMQEVCNIVHHICDDFRGCCTSILQTLVIRFPHSSIRGLTADSPEGNYINNIYILNLLFRLHNEVHY